MTKRFASGRAFSFTGKADDQKKIWWKQVARLTKRYSMDMPDVGTPNGREMGTAGIMRSLSTT